MKKVKVLATVLATFLLFGTAAGCSAGSGLTDILDKIASSSTAKDGEDYITYPNEKRNTVLERFVGDKLDDTSSEALVDNVEVTYNQSEDKDGVYDVYIDNYNKNYFYDGVVRLESDEHTYKINVNMLAPDNYEYFTMEVEGEPEDYLYYVEGDMYKVKEELTAPEDIEYYETDSDYEYLCVVDTSSVDEDMVKSLAEYFYLNDTIYNNDGEMTYYLVSTDNFDDTDSSVYDYKLVVNTKDQSAKAEDADGNSVLSENY